MKRIDLHVHTRASKDAKGSILEIAKAAKAAGMDGIAITDHDSCPNLSEVQEAMSETGILVVPGCESTTIEGHVLCIGVTEAPAKGKSLAELSRLVRDQGGVCVASHPLKVLSGIGPTELMVHHKEGHLSAAEGVNGRDRRFVQDNTIHLLKRLDIPFTGGTDAHFVQDVGTAWTVFEDHVSSTHDVVNAIKSGQIHGDGHHIKRRKIWGHRFAGPVRAVKRGIAKRRHREDPRVELASANEEE